MKIKLIINIVIIFLISIIYSNKLFANEISSKYLKDAIKLIREDFEKNKKLTRENIFHIINDITEKELIFTLLNQAIKSDSEDFYPIMIRGHLFMFFKDYQKASNDYEKCLNILKDKGITLDLPDFYNNPYYCAKEYFDLSKKRQMGHSLESTMQLIDAIDKKNIKLLKQLVENGYDINVGFSEYELGRFEGLPSTIDDDYSYMKLYSFNRLSSPLLECNKPWNTNYNITEYLISKGANIGIQNNRILREYIDKANNFRSYSKDEKLNLINLQIDLILNNISKLDKFELYDAIKNHFKHCNVSLTDGSKDAIYNVNADIKISILEKLLKKGANPNIRSYLIFALEYYYSSGGYQLTLCKVLSVLVKNGAHLDAENDKGETALMVAQNKGDTETIKFINYLKSTKNNKTTPNKSSKKAKK